MFNKTLKEKQLRAAWHIEPSETYKLLSSCELLRTFRLVRLAYIEIGFVCQ